MKKTQRIDLLTTIKGSIVSFFAITMFVGLGVGLFLGIHWLGASMRGMLDSKFAEGRGHALEITFPYGLTEADLAELSQVEGVDEVEAGYLSYQEFEQEGETLVTRVGMLPESIDMFVEVEGELPTRAGEIALNSVNAEAYGISVGDTISFLPDVAEGSEDPDGMAYLTGGTYTVTALVKSPAFLAVYNGTYGVASVGTGTIHVLAWVPEAAFDASAYQDGKPYVLVASHELEGLSYTSDEYKERSTALEERVKELGLTLGTARYNALHSDAEGRLAEGEQQLADAQQQLAEGEQQYEEGIATLEQRRAEAQAQLAAARRRLAQAEAQYEQGEHKLAEGRAALAKAKAAYTEAQRKFEIIERIANESKAEYTELSENYNAAQMALGEDSTARHDALSEEWNATEDEEYEEKVPYIEIQDAREAEASQQVISEHPELDYNKYDLTDEQYEEFWELQAEILDADPEYVAAAKAIEEIGDRYQEIYDSYEARSAEIDEYYETTYEANRVQYNADLDALGDDIEKQLADEGIKLPYKIDHSNLPLLGQADAFVEYAKSVEMDYNGVKVSYNNAPALIAEYQGQIEAGEAALRSAYEQISSGRSQLAAAVATYEEEVAAAEKRLAEAYDQLEEGRTQIEEGQEQLEQGREQLASMEEYGWVVLPRAYNGGAVFTNALIEVIGNLRWSMASLFLIVGILVCYSAVSRLVHEQITRIGTKKAVGFRESEVSALFLCYAALCVALGAVAGAVMAFAAVEPLILRTINTRFVFACPPSFNAGEAALMAALEFALILGSTWVAVRGVLKMQAVELLAGEKPPTAKARFYERWGIWRRMGLLAQTTINNCINDKRRVIGTLVGVSGCTALIVCAMMLNDNVLRSFTREYSAINHYDVVVNLVAGSEAAATGEQAIERAGLDATLVQQQMLSLDQPDGQRSAVYVVVPVDDAEYEEFFSVIPTSEVAQAEDGIWVSQAYAEHFDARPGDALAVSNSRGDSFAIPIEGFFEYHLSSNQTKLTAGQYERIFGKEVAPNRILVKTDGAGVEAVSAALSGMDGVISVTDIYSADKKNFDDFAALSRIMVMVYLALATVMAACVLLNLDFMFVDEKKREIIVLMINGYSQREAKGYIWHDSVVLTALGIVCGLVLGNVVGGLTVLSAEQANTSFLHDISWLALGAGVAGSVVLAVGALVVALRRIDRFDLTDINRF